jgi:hypothetical protein
MATPEDRYYTAAQLSSTLQTRGRNEEEQVLRAEAGGRKCVSSDWGLT